MPLCLQPAVRGGVVCPFETILFITDDSKQTMFITALFITQHIYNRPIMKVVCYERGLL